MKKISLIVIGVMCGFVAIAQEPEDSDPVKSIDIVQMDKFIGKWEWKSKNTSFTFILKKIKLGVFTLLKGECQYIQNGSVVIDSLYNLDEIDKAKIAGIIKKGNDTAKVSFEDPTRQELRHATINFVNRDQNKIFFKFINEKNPQGLNKIVSKPRMFFPVKIPRDLNITLTRIE